MIKTSKIKWYSEGFKVDVEFRAKKFDVEFRAKKVFVEFRAKKVEVELMTYNMELYNHSSTGVFEVLRIVLFMFHIVTLFCVNFK